MVNKSSAGYPLSLVKTNSRIGELDITRLVAIQATFVIRGLPEFILSSFYSQRIYYMIVSMS
jgi:hypothetical protein